MWNNSHRTSIDTGWRLQTTKRRENIHVIGWDKRKNKQKEIRTEPALPGGSWDKGKVSTPWEVPLLVGRSTGMEEELQGLGGAHSHRFAGGKVERDVFKWLVPPPENPQPETLVHCVDSGFRVIPRERTGISCVQTAEMWGGPQLRVHGKKSGAAREARHHGWGNVRWGLHHRRFILCTLETAGPCPHEHLE